MRAARLSSAAWYPVLPWRREWNYADGGDRCSSS